MAAAKKGVTKSGYPEREIWEYFAISYIFPILGGFVSSHESGKNGYRIASILHPFLILYVYPLVIVAISQQFPDTMLGYLGSMLGSILIFMSFFLFFGGGLIITHYLSNKYFDSEKERYLPYVFWFGLIGLIYLYSQASDKKARSEGLKLFLVNTFLGSIVLAGITYVAIIFLF